MTMQTNTPLINPVSDADFESFTLACELLGHIKNNDYIASLSAICQATPSAADSAMDSINLSHTGPERSRRKAHAKRLRDVCQKDVIPVIKGTQITWV